MSPWQLAEYFIGANMPMVSPGTEIRECLPQSLGTKGVEDILAPVAESAHWTDLSSS